MGGLSPTHLILILAIVLIVFGPGRLPEVASALGKAVRDFRKAVEGSDESQATTNPTAGPGGGAPGAPQSPAGAVTQTAGSPGAPQGGPGATVAGSTAQMGAPQGGPGATVAGSTAQMAGATAAPEGPVTDAASHPGTATPTPPVTADTAMPTQLPTATSQ